jgi:cytochrome c553
MNAVTKPRKEDMMNTVKTRSRTKKILVLSGWLLLAVVVAAGIVYGPELVGLYQLSKQIETISQDNTRLGGPWPRASDACIYCHGYEGNARAQTYPRLAGQPEAYLKKQLTAFASGERSDPNMTPLALSMSEREIDSFAAHFSKMSLQPNTTFQADAARAARGEAVAKANNCAACHGQQLEGKDAYPRLAGQGYDYLRDQLTRFKNGTRHDATGVMPAIAGPLSQQDIDDLAQYLASR